MHAYITGILSQVHMRRMLWSKRQEVFIGDGHDEEEAALSSEEEAMASVSGGLRLGSGSLFVL